MNNNIEFALRELSEAVKRIVMDRIRRYGTNPRTGTNTLIGSDLEKSIDVRPTDDGIVLQIADYWEFVSRGWSRTGNYPGTMSQFVKNVNDWVIRKGIHLGNLTQNQIVWIVIRKIWDHGIKARPFMVYDDEGDLEKMIPELSAYMDDWFDQLFDAIMEETNKYFNAA
jgi:hypothetical protein